MNKLIAIVFISWALGMLGLWLSNSGYVTFGKLLVYIFGPIGIICIFVGLFFFVKKARDEKHRNASH